MDDDVDTICHLHRCSHHQLLPRCGPKLGYSRNIAYALTAPPHILCMVAVMYNRFYSDKRQTRYWHNVGPICVLVIANIIAVSTLNRAVPYVVMIFMPGSAYAGSTVLLSWVSGSINQPAVKRAAAIALINAVCNTPNIWTSYQYSGALMYLAAFLVSPAAAVLAILDATFTLCYLRKQNRKMEQGLALLKSGPKTRQQSMGFRYML